MLKTITKARIHCLVVVDEAINAFLTKKIAKNDTKITKSPKIPNFRRFLQFVSNFRKIS